MTTPTVEERLRDLIVDHLGVEAERVTPEAHILDDLGADSLDTIELVMAMELEFNFEISDSDVEDAKTVADLLALIPRAT